MPWSRFAGRNYFQGIGSESRGNGATLYIYRNCMCVFCHVFHDVRSFNQQPDTCKKPIQALVLGLSKNCLLLLLVLNDVGRLNRRCARAFMFKVDQVFGNCDSLCHQTRITSFDVLRQHLMRLFVYILAK